MLEVEEERRPGDRVLRELRAEAAPLVRRCCRATPQARAGASCTSRRSSRSARRAASTSACRTGPSRPSPRPPRARAGCRRRRCRSAGGGSAVRAPVEDRPRDAEPDRVHRRLVGVDPGRVPLQPEVVVDARVVRLRRRLDQRRRDVAVLVEHVRRQPLLHDRDRALVSDCDCVRKSRFRSKLLPFGRAVRDPAVRVVVDVPEQDDVVEDRVDLGDRCRTAWSPAARRGRTSRRRPRTRCRGCADWTKIGTLTSSPARSSIPCARAGSVSAILRMFCQVWKSLPLLGRVERVDRDEVHVAAERGLADHLDVHPAVAAGLDVGKRAGERVPRDVREAADRMGRIAPVGQRGGQRPGSACRTRAAKRRSRA